MTIRWVMLGCDDQVGNDHYSNTLHVHTTPIHPCTSHHTHTPLYTTPHPYTPVHHTTPIHPCTSHHTHTPLYITPITPIHPCTSHHTHHTPVHHTHTLLNLHTSHTAHIHTHTHTTQTTLFKHLQDRITLVI